MKILLFGATGMVGQAVLDSCLRSDEVEKVLCVGRSSCGRTHAKLAELIHSDMFNLGPVADQLRGYDCCFFPLGVSSAGMKEADYTRLTYDLVTSVAKLLKELNPGMGFLYVSGKGTDSTGKGPLMWARVKGRTENALLGMGFKPAVMVRLGGLVPLKDFHSKTPWIRFFSKYFGWLLSLLHRAWPGMVTTPEILGRAFIRAAKGQSGPILEPDQIHRLGS